MNVVENSRIFYLPGLVYAKTRMKYQTYITHISTSNNNSRRENTHTYICTNRRYYLPTDL